MSSDPTPHDHQVDGAGKPGESGLCRLEFLVEPFSEGRPGPHVLGALESLRSRGIEVNQGPFGNTVAGDRQTVTAAMLTLIESAFERGASRLLMNLTQAGEDQPAPQRDRTLPPIRVGTELEGQAAVDAPGAWQHPMTAPTQTEDIHGAVERMMGAVEAQMGGELGDLSREKKQAAVRILDEQGAFLIRKSVETVAEAMGVSRITIYNYLNAIRGD